MSSRRVLPILLLCLTALAHPEDHPLDAGGLPSREFTFRLMDEQPDMVWEMVRKLYSIEHTVPDLTVPDLTYIGTQDGGLYVGYADGKPVVVTVGSDIYKIIFEFNIKSRVLEGYRPERKVPAAWYIGAGAVLFLGGVIVGLISD